MAIIDVDRHILAQLVMLQNDIKILSAKYQIEWDKCIQVRDKTDALFSPPQRGTDNDFNVLKRMIFRSTKNCQKIVNEIAGKIYQQEALLLHLVSEIREVDSGKGAETHGPTNTK